MKIDLYVMYDTYNSKYIPCKVEEILAVEWNRPQIPSLAMCYVGFRTRCTEQVMAFHEEIWHVMDRDVGFWHIGSTLYPAIGTSDHQ